jgi:acid phosphatase
MTHIINGAAGNLESHSEFSTGQSQQNITAVLNNKDYGFSKLTVVNSTALKWEYIRGDDGKVGDSLMLLKPAAVKSHKPGKRARAFN